MVTKKGIKLTKVNDASVPEVVKSAGFRFPRSLLEPIGRVLSEQIKKLEFRKKTLDKDDPFQNTERLSDNAALDTDASEQLNHARVHAVQRQLDRQIVQLRKALARVKIGSYGICESCGKMIDTDRLMVYPEATFCVKCETKREK
ncbi:MAG: Transcriptional regulator, TraR/DksA family [Microgenomates group bacterium GW2011_GWA1_Microgenomates_45_10]|nr:MAG: Transcriptional regulator, TraR/DksA family [Microgenomates group bacterium GW2011_GWA2_44_7]KKT77281.1 MAG: Transcriptional regulator, TraR/DksA family [Microgenomates group bacterium GW2011_GWB1_44_8]KKT87457.1 MAG: Transcriptional regulator, TraR/DksA family [Microgenomates group bacterium GW2011_GWA1_Microgenomates_45_10]